MRQKLWKDSGKMDYLELEDSLLIIIGFLGISALIDYFCILILKINDTESEKIYDYGSFALY